MLANVTIPNKKKYGWSMSWEYFQSLYITYDNTQIFQECIFQERDSPLISSTKLHLVKTYKISALWLNHHHHHHQCGQLYPFINIKLNQVLFYESLLLCLCGRIKRWKVCTFIPMHWVFYPIRSTNHSASWKTYINYYNIFKVREREWETENEVW